ncbi:hypothetical protein J1605_013958 [Eschrichtius robustus]|uniref:Uncharacterized protein n=1 Tax=Eschrichtius robustus TaxID=9764 RepID=A0AB34GDW6_ESCRO|nr:hypothetical protein J1605_013958 [Eschrichtius robustus]
MLLDESVRWLRKAVDPGLGASGRGGRSTAEPRRPAAGSGKPGLLGVVTATERRNEDPPNRWFPRRPEKRGEAVRGPDGQSPASPPPPPRPAPLPHSPVLARFKPFWRRRGPR